MKNISLLLNIVLLAAVAHLYYLTLKKSGPASPAIVASASAQSGARIAFVSADTLDERYEWLRKQKEAIEQRARNAGNSLNVKKEALQKEFIVLQQKYEAGNTPLAEIEKEDAKLKQRAQRLQEEEESLTKSLANDQKKAFEDLYANLEGQLKTLSDRIGYDYILSYSRGGPILLANDSLDITNQVLELLNAESKK